MKVNRDNLNSIMEFDHVIRVHEDGTVTEPEGVYAPEDIDVAIVDETTHVPWEPWELLTGHTNQYGYNGACFHPSEYIGGSLADYILSHPGLYVAVIVTDNEPDADGVAGWAIAYQPIHVVVDLDSARAGENVEIVFSGTLAQCEQYIANLPNKDDVLRGRYGID